MLGGGIVVLLAGLAFLLYDSYEAFAECVGESSCTGLFTAFFVSILEVGIALALIGIAAIVYTQLRKRRGRNETMARLRKNRFLFLGMSSCYLDIQMFP